jgi:iron(III) transport system substrate-binding protein
MAGIARITGLLAMTAVLVRSGGAQDPAWQRVLDAGRREGTVVVASSSLSGAAAVSVIRAVKEKFGISVELFSGRMAVAVEKIQTEQKSKNYVTDIMDEGGMSLLMLRKAGFLQSAVGSLPAAQDKSRFSYPLADDPEGEMLNILAIHTFLCYNTSLIRAEDVPGSYRSLLDPKWKGKIFLMNPRYTTAPEEQLLAFTKPGSGLDENFFAGLYRNSVVGGPGGSEEAMDKLVRGEVAIAGFLQGATALKAIRAGAPVKILDLKEGHLSKTMKLGLLRNAPHPNAARVYMNWLLSPEGQALVTRETGLEPVRKDVPASMPFHLTGPSVNFSFQDLLQAEAHREKNYMANLVGVKER